MELVMDIRKASRRDLPAVTELWKAFMDFHGRHDDHFTRSKRGHLKFRDFVAAKISDRSSLVLVARADSETVGYLVASIRRYPPVLTEKKFGGIFDLMVAPSHRRRGVGRRLVAEAKKWFRRKGVSRVELSVAVRNPLSTKFWTRMGFVTYMERRFLKLPGP